jgi:hypothetical protein
VTRRLAILIAVASTGVAPALDGRTQQPAMSLRAYFGSAAPITDTDLAAVQSTR